MSVARKYYNDEWKKYRRERTWFFKNPREVEQAVEYACRAFKVPMLMVEFKPTPTTQWGGHYVPANILNGVYKPKLILYKDTLHLLVVAHEVAHHLHIEQLIEEHRFIRGLGMLGRGKRIPWHCKAHAQAMEFVVELLKRKYGNRTPPSCAKAKPVVKERK